MRGEAANADDHTFVGFYIVPWFNEMDDTSFHDDTYIVDANGVLADWIDTFNNYVNLEDTPITSADSLWFNLYIIDRSSAQTGDSFEISGDIYSIDSTVYRISID